MRWKWYSFACGEIQMYNTLTDGLYVTYLS